QVGEIPPDAAHPLLEPAALAIRQRVPEQVQPLLHLARGDPEVVDRLGGPALLRPASPPGKAPEPLRKEVGHAAVNRAVTSHRSLPSPSAAFLHEGLGYRSAGT